MPLCIYCLDPKATYPSREHVMPQAYGSFEPVNFILTEDVCFECNQYFGRELETPGTRASVEGVHRYITEHLMSHDSFLKMPKGRVRWESAEPDAQDVQLYHRRTEDGEVEAVMAPQIITIYEDGRRKSFRLEELTEPGVLDGAKSYRPYADSPEAVQKLRAALEAIGVQPVWGEMQKTGERADGTIRVTAFIMYDNVNRRLAAKIAFNYLAYRLGGAFARKPDFNDIRRFIRYDEGPGKELVAVSEVPILREERGMGNWSMRDSHLVKIDPSIGGGLMGSVSIFNLVRNDVLLSKTNPEVVHSGLIPGGHEFLWRSHKIKPMVAVEPDSFVQPPELLGRRR